MMSFSVLMNNHKILFYLRFFCFCFPFHLSYPHRVAAKTPSENQKPPTYMNSVAFATYPQMNPMAPLTNANITKTSHLSTNDQER